MGPSERVDHAYWMPFTANRAFRAAPRMVSAADRHAYRTPDGRTVRDTIAGLWTSGLGHGRPEIAAAVAAQIGQLDYAPGFQVGHPGAFELAARLVAMAPPGFSHCFFTNSGSESVDTALKIALAWHRVRGDASRTRLVGRERGYHGVNCGGLSVGGIAANRKAFGPALLPGVLHLPATVDLSANAFSRGQPQFGGHWADALDDLVRLHDASNIAAVIIEPVSGSGGVLVPPTGYLERLRELCTRHGILLIFDEVITAFGRLGAATAAERFGVTPDLITLAKGVTNGVIPMGAVLVRDGIQAAFMNGPAEAIELFHGYTYSGHPVACAAALASLDIYQREQSFAAARALEEGFADILHGFAGQRHVIDVRNFGLMGAIELAPRSDAPPGTRGFEVHRRCFEAGVMVRNGGDTLQFAPFFDDRADDLAAVFARVSAVLATVD